MLRALRIQSRRGKDPRDLWPVFRPYPGACVEDLDQLDWRDMRPHEIERLEGHGRWGSVWRIDQDDVPPRLYLVEDA